MNIRERLEREIEKFKQTRGAMPVGWNEQLLTDALEEIKRLTLSEKEPVGDAYKEAVEMNLRLRKALEQCVRVCRDWHAMPGKPGPHDAFDIYFNHSPEMKLIRDALGKMPDPTEA